MVASGDIETALNDIGKDFGSDINGSLSSLGLSGAGIDTNDFYKSLVGGSNFRPVPQRDLERH